MSCYPRWLLTLFLVLLIVDSVSAKKKKKGLAFLDDDDEEASTTKEQCVDASGNECVVEDPGGVEIPSYAEHNQQCGLYMAESAIPNAGLGMFTAVNIDRGAVIFSGDVVVQVEDYSLNQKLRRRHLKNLGNKVPKEGKWLLNNYYWDSSMTLGDAEADDVDSIIPGLGMLANSHTGLYNAENAPPTRTNQLHRGRDPGTGASTDYHNLHFTARRFIPAGQELFVKYGDSWFEQRSGKLGKLPLSGHFRKADEMLKLYWDAIEPTLEASEEDGDVDERTAEKVWDLVLYAIKGQPRLYNALPKNWKDTDTLRHTGTAFATVPEGGLRSVEWLQHNGICMDNIEPKPSTIPQAGMGAFATRNLFKGQIILPMPVVQLKRQDMEVYESDDPDDPNAETSLVAQQLLLNYCYGHPESSLLLYPYSPVSNYLNHHPTDYNAELRWSKHPMHQKSWLQRTVDDIIKNEDHSGLILEVVALRAIEKGEEIFINYGASWQKAWEEYTQQWTPDEEDLAYKSAKDYNEEKRAVKTQDELEEEPYDAEVGTICFISNDHEPVEEAEGEEEALFWKNLSGVGDYAIAWFQSNDAHVDGRMKIKPGHPHFGERNLDYYHQCTILGREEPTGTTSSPTYAVMVPTDSDDEEEQQQLIYLGLPRENIEFVDISYSSDNWLRTAFRHEIHLPNHLVPRIWRDLI